MSLAGRSVTRPLNPSASDDQDDDAVWIAQRMVLDAGAQAARLRRQASVQTATICAAAEREAETIWQQASVQAAAIREAAERETAALRAAVIKLSATPGELTVPAVPGELAAGPEAKPVIRCAAEPGTSARRRPQGPTRQLVAIRVATAATAALFLFAVTAGTTELALHGFAFFVFRSAGTGETNPNGLQEDQGPGQPGAPKPTPSHISVTAKPAQRDHRLKAQSGKKGSHGG
jgi:hypothetical protein